MKKEYNIGLDIGTTSVGWAVVEVDNQKVMKKGKKALWGARLFEEADTAADRRTSRSTRRRYDRRRERIKLLQEEFKDEINKVDPEFFTKLQNSKYSKKDKNNKRLRFSEEEINGAAAYYNEYPTIYHLRKALMEEQKQFDIRLVYLAIHHIIKYRGNFLYEGKNFSVKDISLEDQLRKLIELLIKELPELELTEDDAMDIDFKEFSDAFFKETRNDVKVTLKSILKSIDSTFANEFSKLMVGNKANITKMLKEDSSEKIEVTFLKNDYDDEKIYNKCLTVLGEKIEIYDLIKNIYDTVTLKKILGKEDNPSISNKIIKMYDKFSEDFRWLKETLRKDREVYNAFFKSSKGEKSPYEKYMSSDIDNNELKNSIDKSMSALIELNNISQENLDKYKNEILLQLENNTFLCKTNSTDNGIYPYQLNENELIQIIENQGKYYPFLLEKYNEDTYRIVRLLEFKIPYYIGPLVTKEKSKNAWLIKTTKTGKITPFNFDTMIDKEKTAIEFIKRMSSHCSYLLDEYAMPTNSILYSEFKVRNELKQIKINGKSIDLNLQQKIFEELFKTTTGSITERKFINYIKTTGEFSMYNDDINIAGYSSTNSFANNMQTYIDFFGSNGIFENTKYNTDDAEQIIEWITIFEDKGILEKTVKDNYPLLSNEQIQLILNKKYKGWGNLSKKLLTTKYYKDKQTEVYKSIMDLLKETKENFMQIINNKEYKFQKMIEEYNNNSNATLSKLEIVNKLATSPANKKGIYQALKVVDEIVDYLGYEPKNIMIEMSREEGKKVRTVDRKSKLQNLYNECKNQIVDYKRLRHELDSRNITTEKLYLYFIQEGKCLYSGKPLEIEKIEDVSMYEVDHIIPRSLVKDDSIDNKALVIRKYNQEKKDNLVLPKAYRNLAQIQWWQRLKNNGLMSAKKFHNLTRDEYSDEDIDGFINRQLVETRQIIKHVANILGNEYRKTKILYPKASLSHNYRERYELYKFRNINDYHHAHDAYLAAVLGEYSDKYMKKRFDFSQIKEINKKIIDLNDKEKIKYGYVINSLDERVSNIVINSSKNMTDEKTGEVLFDAKKFNETVVKNLYRNDILISRKNEIRSGQFYKETIYKRRVGTIPIKKDMPVDIYGGYSNNETKYLKLVKYGNGKKKLIGIPMNLAALNDTKIIDNYIKYQLKLKNSDTYEVLKNIIPFETEIIYNNQNVYIKGYSVMGRTCEVSNAHELKIKKDLLYNWRYALNYFINGKEKDVEEAKKHSIEIYNFLVESIDYPLFNNELKKIRENIKFDTLEIEKQKKVILELFKLFKCSSINANLKEFDLSDRIGRLSGINIKDGYIITKSTTGLKEFKYKI